MLLLSIKVEAVTTTDKSTRVCQPHRGTNKTSPVVTGLTLPMKGGGDARSLGISTTPKRAVSTNLRTNSPNMLPHDILARERRTSNATKTLLPTANVAIVGLVLGTKTGSLPPKALLATRRGKLLVPGVGLFLLRSR